MLALTIVIMTSHLDSIWTIVGRFVVLENTRVIAAGTLKEVILQSAHVIQQFFRGEPGLKERSWKVK
jgi:ABC-type transporter Mla maintaining outer membrane lipid asymmetry ATPase subunit MlaF